MADLRLHRLALTFLCLWLIGPASAAPSDWQVTVRKGSGDLRLKNTSAGARNLVGYSIAFPTSQLRADDWLPIAGRLDAGGDQSFDPNDNWLVFGTQPLPSQTNNLSEGEFTGNGGFLLSGDSLFLGSPWNTLTSLSLNFEAIEVVAGNQISSQLDITYLPAGDFNEDGSVDALDYSLWRDSLGQTGLGLLADADGSGTVDALDYGLWKSTFGQTSTTVPASGSLSLAAAQVVPEPSTMALFGAMSLLLAGLRWRMG